MYVTYKLVSSEYHLSIDSFYILYIPSISTNIYVYIFFCFHFISFCSLLLINFCSIVHMILFFLSKSMLRHLLYSWDCMHEKKKSCPLDVHRSNSPEIRCCKLDGHFSDESIFCQSQKAIKALGISSPLWLDFLLNWSCFAINI